MPTHLVILASHFSCSEERIRNGVKKLQKSKQGATQERLDSFFKAIPSPIADKRKVLTCVCVCVCEHVYSVCMLIAMYPYKNGFLFRPSTLVF